MLINRSLKISNKPSVLTIGNFDGVHLGHLKIINYVKKIAKKENLAATILTFAPHPIKIFKPENFKDFHITNLSQKLKIFRENNLDIATILHFNKDFANLTADNFVKILVEHFNVKHLVVGYDFIFGRNRKGNIEFLKKSAEIYGFKLTIIDAIKNVEIFSSSLVRKFIKNGEIKKANKILGKNFEIIGRVQKGRQLARKIGFPTLNFIPIKNIVQPKFGVYKILAKIPFLGKNFDGIMNFGIKPTIFEQKNPIFEAHLFSFDEFSEIDLENKKIFVEIIDFIREERKFGSLDELKKQIIIDLKKSIYTL